MTSLSEIVNVQISVQNAGVSRQGFGTALFIGLHKVFTERVREYEDVDSLLTDGFDPDSLEVAFATAVFSQNITPTSIKIGRRHTDDVTSITPSPVADNTAYTVSINGTDFTVDSGAGATASSIATALFTAINAGAEPVTATDEGGYISLVPDVAATDYTVTTTENLTVVLDDYGAESLTTALTDIRNEDDDWYALAAHTHADDDILELAGQVETLNRIYLYSTASADVITSATTDIGSQLNALNYDRTAGIYDPDADTAFPEAAWLGVELPKDPGASTWAFKTLVGQDADALTTTQANNALGKKVNVYQTIGGVDITRNGTVASGEYIDVIRGIDWLTARMTERIFTLLAERDKIPFTQEGVTIVENQVRAQLREAVSQGVIAADPEFTITVPTVSEISSAVKATRQLPSITFTATLAGAIHKVTVVGKVSV